MERWLLRTIGLLLMASAFALALSQAPDRSVESLVARWAPPPSQFIELHGQLVHLRDVGPRGDAMPLVLLHGAAGSLHTWEAWARALQVQHRVITVDLPGSGLTGPFTGRYQAWAYSGEALARFVLELLDELKVPQFAIAGHSLGGEVAWHMAALAPERVRKLVLVSAAGVAAPPQPTPLALKLASVPVLNRAIERLLPHALVDAALRRLYGDPQRVTPVLVDRYFETLLREGNRRALVQRLQQYTTDQNTLPAGAAARRMPQRPTLLIWGARDRLVPPATGQRLAEEIADSRLVVIDGLGHLPQEEDPAASVAPVQAFLAAP